MVRGGGDGDTDIDIKGMECMYVDGDFWLK